MLFQLVFYMLCTEVGALQRWERLRKSRVKTKENNSESEACSHFSSWNNEVKLSQKAKNYNDGEVHPKSRI